MVMKIIKSLWVVATLIVLFVTLYAFDGQSFSDIWVFLTWGMLILSFPLSLVVSLVHYILGDWFSITIQTSYLSLGIEWTIYFVLGYVQWFVSLPQLWSKWKARKVVRNK